jgi:hypothetical protein
LSDSLDSHRIRAPAVSREAFDQIFFHKLQSPRDASSSGSDCASASFVQRLALVAERKQDASKTYI